MLIDRMCVSWSVRRKLYSGTNKAFHRHLKTLASSPSCRFDRGATVNNDFTPASCQTDHYFIISPSLLLLFVPGTVSTRVVSEVCYNISDNTKFSPTYKNISTSGFVGVCSQIENGHMHLWLNRHGVSRTFGTVFRYIKKVYWSKTFKRQKLNCRCRLFLP